MYADHDRCTNVVGNMLTIAHDNWQSETFSVEVLNHTAFYTHERDGVKQGPPVSPTEVVLDLSKS